MLSAEIFYGTQIHVIAPQLAAQMSDLARTRFWSFGDQTEAHEEDSTLARKCMTWGLMVAAEAVDPCHDGHAEALMQTVFDVQFFDAEDFSMRDPVPADEPETAWERFHGQVLKQFLYPTFLIQSWKRCWVKHWKLSKYQKYNSPKV